MTFIQPYIDAVMRERSWSWAVVCLLYILAALFVRGWFMGPLFTQLKMVEKKEAHKLKSFYLKYSLLGWIFFFLPLLVIVFYWQKDTIPFEIQDSLLVGAGAVSLVLSILLHLQAFGTAALMTLESTEKEKISDI